MTDANDQPPTPEQMPNINPEVAASWLPPSEGRDIGMYGLPPRDPMKTDPLKVGQDPIRMREEAIRDQTIAEEAARGGRTR